MEVETLAANAAPHRTRWTVADVDLLPDNATRYEIVDGDLFMSKQPHWHHQRTCGLIFRALDDWSARNGLGETSMSPGVIFSEWDAVAPDVVWVSRHRLQSLMDEAGHLGGAPELVVEVLSPGKENEQRDRQAKLKLYESRGVQEYWIVDWQLKQVEVYQRERGALKLASTLFESDELTSPVLPGFTCRVAQLF